jgi:predicted nucleotidyltransferase
MKNGLDSQVYIATEVSFDKIKPRHQAILNNVKEELFQRFSKKLHSIYVYGSVATGKAKPDISDLDVLIVFKKKLTIAEKMDLKSIQNNLTTEYINFFRDIGLESIDLSYLLNKKHRFGYPCFIKHLCVFFWGKNLQERLPKFKPDINVADEFNGDLEKHIKNVKDTLKKTANKPEHVLLMKGIMKKIIRTAFSLVMPRDNSWTTDLKIMSKAFIKYYPEHCDQVITALRWTKSPPQERKLFFKFMDDFGGWLIGEFKLQISDRRIRK